MLLKAGQSLDDIAETLHVDKESLGTMIH
jgi:hypothetical protein